MYVTADKFFICFRRIDLFFRNPPKHCLLPSDSGWSRPHSLDLLFYMLSKLLLLLLLFLPIKLLFSKFICEHTCKTLLYGIS